LIEGTIVEKIDDSILGTWLDPAFDQTATTPSKKERWWFHVRHKRMPREKQEVAAAENDPPIPIEKTVTQRQVKLLGVIVTGMVLGSVGWRLFDSNKAQSSLSPSKPLVSPARSESSVDKPQDGEDASPIIAKHDRPSASDGKKSDDPSEAKSRVSAGKVVQLPRPREDSHLKRRRLELEVDRAIRRRAIAGVTVHFAAGRAHLKGRVATEAQRAAAEKAARDVSGVEDVRSSIETGF
jgi:hypothetical protein